MPDPAAIADFVHQVETSLRTRRLYAPHMGPYQEAAARLLERCQTALAGEGFSLRLGPTDLFHGKTSVLHRPKREECFFFPLYRDGLRELTFQADLAKKELEALLSAFECEEKGRLPPGEDTVAFLWRCDLHGITWAAIDGIGDQEGDDDPDAGKDDYRALVADLAAKIQAPAAPETGQSYAFVLDADVRVSASDMHYESQTRRRAFEENPTVLRLSAAEAQALRADACDRQDAELLDEFVLVLFSMLCDPASGASEETLRPVVQRLLEGYWAGGEIPSLLAMLARLREAAASAPRPENRATAASLLQHFLDAQRVAQSLELVKSGRISVADAAAFWELAGDAHFDALIGFLAALGEGEQRQGVAAYLRSRLAIHPELLRPALTASDAARARAALSLLDERLEPYYAKDLLALASHPVEQLRMKGVQYAGKLGGAAGFSVLWKAMESERANAVRLLAFRQMELARPPALVERLRTLLASGSFAERPVWERIKYARLLGKVAGDAARPLFESWIPRKRWFWQGADFERTEVALHGLTSCGPAGRAEVEEMAEHGGKRGGIAWKVLDELSRRDPQDTLSGVTEPGARPR